MEDIEIKCPRCLAVNEQLFRFEETGAKECCKCGKWFKWRTNKVITYVTEKIVQSE
jgi:hypothetical protein